MKSLAGIRRLGARETKPHSSERHPIEVVPFGQYGGGMLTGHPVGLVIVLGILFMGIVGIPEARPFFAASAVLGRCLGFSCGYVIAKPLTSATVFPFAWRKSSRYRSIGFWYGSPVRQSTP